MPSLVFNHGSYFGVFSVGNKKIWKKIGKVDKGEAKKILKQLVLSHAKFDE